MTCSSPEASLLTQQRCILLNQIRETLKDFQPKLVSPQLFQSNGFCLIVECELKNCFLFTSKNSITPKILMKDDKDAVATSSLPSWRYQVFASFCFEETPVKRVLELRAEIWPRASGDDPGLEGIRVALRRLLGRYDVDGEMRDGEEADDHISESMGERVYVLLEEVGDSGGEK